MAVEEGTDGLGFFAEETAAATPTAVDGGSGGDDLATFTSDRVQQLQSLYVRTFTNNSRFATPAGIGGEDPVVTLGVFAERGPDRAADTAVTPAGGEAGSGGANLGSWDLSRREQLQSLFVGTFTNNSSFPTPPGLGNVPSNPAGVFTEELPGYSVEGILRDGNRDPIGGDVRLIEDSTVVAANTVFGLYSIERAVPVTVEQGPNGEGPSVLDFEFEPTTGFTKVVEGISIPAATVDAKYGSVSGVVTDVDGTPVANDEVIGESGGETKSAFTDENGDYQFDGPDAQDVTIRGLRASTDITFSFAEFVNTTQDLQYAGIDVTLEIPGGIAAEDVFVDVVETGVSGRTDANGLQRFLTVPIDQTVTVRGWEAVEEAIATGGQGTKSTLTVVAGVGVQGSLVDAADGADVEAVDVKLIAGDTESRARSTGTGRYQVGNPNAGEVTVRISDDDWRYERTEVTQDVADGSSIVLDETLEPTENIGTTT